MQNPSRQRHKRSKEYQNRRTGGVSLRSDWNGDDSVADVTGDGDGYADIVAYGHTAIYASINDGYGAFSAHQTWLTNDAEGNGMNFVTDSNQVELMLGVGWGDKRWSANYPRGVDDVNGDGRADIWAIGEHGVYVAWSRY